MNFPAGQVKPWYSRERPPEAGLKGCMVRKLKSELLLAENIRTLLYRRHLDAGALATWCGHGESWISKIINGKRGAQVKDLGKIADFFGLTVAQLFQHGISELAERRKTERRTSVDRRTGQDRRQPIEGRLHPDVQAGFPPRRFYPEDGDGHVQRLRLRSAESSPKGSAPPKAPPLRPAR